MGIKKSKYLRPKDRDIVERTFGMWKVKETGAEYIRNFRKESEKRFKRLEYDK